ncbi:hypothetical protein [Burkholderia perseverans]|uniref:hypothetical protein n=1 Tax=Burkholderia perseverans TaxID=2615214 RepID=UPI001FEF1635|nr:hypothetical protein [Burkholderia perseverans]
MKMQIRIIRSYPNFDEIFSQQLISSRLMTFAEVEEGVHVPRREGCVVVVGCCSPQSLMKSGRQLRQFASNQIIYCDSLRRFVRGYLIRLIPMPKSNSASDVVTRQSSLNGAS